MVALERKAEVWPDPSSIPRVSRDPDDDYLFALAESAEVSVVVSGDGDVHDVAVPGIRVLTSADSRCAF